MIDTSASRTQVLSSVRAALGVPAIPRTLDPSFRWAELPRPYTRTTVHPHEHTLELLTDRLRDYDAEVVTATESSLPGTVAELLRARALGEVLMPEGVPLAWLPAGVRFVVDQGFAPAELDRFGGVLTGATLAIAETGTLVLQNVPGQGRRAATLVPDYHLCVVRTADVVATVPEAMDRLHPTATLPTTLISGPSATADIEMTRIKGVHGPRFLDVVLLG